MRLTASQKLAWAARYEQVKKPKVASPSAELTRLRNLLQRRFNRDMATVARAFVREIAEACADKDAPWLAVPTPKSVASLLQRLPVRSKALSQAAWQRCVDVHCLTIVRRFPTYMRLVLQESTRRNA